MPIVRWYFVTLYSDKAFLLGVADARFTGIHKDVFDDYYNNKQATSQVDFYKAEGALPASPKLYKYTVSVEKVTENPTYKSLNDFGILQQFSKVMIKKVDWLIQKLEEECKKKRNQY